MVEPLAAKERFMAVIDAPLHSIHWHVLQLSRDRVPSVFPRRICALRKDHQQETARMKLFNFDVFATRSFDLSTEPRKLFAIYQGHTPDDYELHLGPWYVVASRISGRVDGLGS